ncbi:Uncharacterized protein Adt_42265 [Abeliophyllum distichum]|uniref:Uncharacterized protein n=1 Tax=Abeliophyllum distichum TaxID=126358 RepID=A0ABD1PR61_9LAMI
MVRHCFVDKNGMKKGAWSKEEDDKLRAYVLRYGYWNWRLLPKYAGLARCGKSCRLRWMNYLKPGLKRVVISKEEEDLIMELHNQMGNKWSAIAAKLPGRTDNEVKNYWHSHIKKRNTQKTAATKVIVEQTSEIQTLKESEDLMLSPNTANGIACDTTSLDSVTVLQDTIWSETFLPFEPLELFGQLNFGELSSSDFSILSALNWVGDDSVNSSHSAEVLANFWAEPSASITTSSSNETNFSLPSGPLELSGELNFSELSSPDFSILSALNSVGDDSVNSSYSGAEVLANFWAEPSASISTSSSNETNFLLPVEKGGLFSPYISYYDDSMISMFL